MVQDLITLPEHLNSSVFNRVRVALYCFMCNLLKILVFLFGHWVVRPSSIYSFWLPFCIFILFPTVMPFLWCMASDYLFGIFKLLATVLSVPWCTTSDCHFGSFNIVSTVLSVRLRLTGSHYPLGIFNHSTIVLSFLLRFTVSDYPFDIFNVCPLSGVEISVLRCFTTSDCNFDNGRRDGDRIVVGFTTTYAINAYDHWCCEFASRSVEVYSI